MRQSSAAALSAMGHGRSGEQLTQLFASADALRNSNWAAYFERVYGIDTMVFPFALSELSYFYYQLLPLSVKSSLVMHRQRLEGGKHYDAVGDIKFGELYGHGGGGITSLSGLPPARLRDLLNVWRCINPFCTGHRRYQQTRSRLWQYRTACRRTHAWRYPASAAILIPIISTFVAQLGTISALAVASTSIYGERSCFGGTVMSPTFSDGGLAAWMKSRTRMEMSRNGAANTKGAKLTWSAPRVSAVTTRYSSPTTPSRHTRTTRSGTSTTGCGSFSRKVCTTALMT